MGHLQNGRAPAAPVGNSGSWIVLPLKGDAPAQASTPVRRAEQLGLN